MRQMVILSGKGGTGKTSVTAALAHLASQGDAPVLADADVDAANLELVLSPRLKERHDFVGGKEAIIDPDKCTACGTCATVCRFEAVVEGDTAYAIDPIACEGCAACFYQCPAEAIRMEERVAGEWFVSETPYGPLVHARLRPAQENSGKLVSVVRQKARLIAQEEGRDPVIIDGPPGIGCPVISAVSGVDLALIVAEPTVAGIHDLERVLSTVEHFRVKPLVVVNKCDLSPESTRAIVRYCDEKGIEVVGQIPFDLSVTRAMVKGLPVTRWEDGAASREMRRIWERVRAVLLGP